MESKKIKSPSLKVKLIVLCLVLLAIPSIIIGSIGYTIAKSELDKAGRTELKNDTRFVISMIDGLDKEVKAGHINLEDAQNIVRDEVLGPKNAQGLRPDYKKQGIDLGQYGYIFIANDKGIVMAHPSIEGKDMSNLMTPDGKLNLGQALLGIAKNGTGDYIVYPWTLPNSTNQYSSKITYVEQDKNWGWIVCAGSYMSDYNSGASNVLYVSLITLGISLLLGAVLIWLFASYITKPIRLMAHVFGRIAEGDLTVQDIKIKSHDEIGQLGSAFTKMIYNLRSVVTEIASSSEQVASASEELTASAQDSSNATGHIASVISDVSEGTDRQVKSTNESTIAIQNLHKGVEEITASARQAVESATRSTEIAGQGNQSIQTAVSQMKSINSTVQELEQLVRGLGKHSDQIGQIVEVITGISDQTNLLALNAAIEAARAGEQGRGFAVVADEVRKLAAQSSESAQQITNLIRGIQTETEQAIESMEKNTKEVASGIEVVNSAGTSFELILKAITEVTREIQGVLTSSEAISKEAISVVSAIDTIATVAEETANGTSSVSAATEEQLATMEEITNSSAALAKMAEELRSIVEKFKV